MTNNTLGDWVKEGNEKWTKKNIDNKQSFIKGYFSNLDWKSKVIFLDSLKKEDYLSWAIKRDFLDYLEQNKKEFNGVNIDKITIKDLKRILGSDISQLYWQRNAIISLILSEYDNLDGREIIWEIEQKSILELKDLFKSSKERLEFLSALIERNEKIQESKKISFFEKLNFTEKNIQEIEQLDLQNGGKLLPILKELDTRNRSMPLWSTDANALADFLRLDFLDSHFKKQIIIDFLPIISIYDAKNIGIISKTQIEWEKKRKINEMYDSNYIQEIWEKNLVELLKDEDNFINTWDYLNDGNIRAIINDSVFSKKIVDNYIDNFNTSLDIIKTRVANTWPQSLDDLIVGLEQINKDNRFQWLEKLREWNIMKYIEKDEEWKDQISYLKIIAENNEKKTFSTRVIGEWNKIWKDNNSELTHFSHLNLYKILEKSPIKLEFFTSKEIEEQKKDPNNPLDDFDLHVNKIEDLSDQEYKKNLQEKYTQKLEQDIKELEQEFELKPQDKDLEKILDQKKRSQEMLWDDSSDEKLLYFINLQKLVNLLDEIDQDGKKYGLEKWTLLETNEGFYEITWIDLEKSEIKLKWNGQIKEESLSFELFVNAFRINKTKRIKNFQSFDQLINESKEKNKKWGNHELVDGKIIAKSVDVWWKIQDQEVTYLTSDKNNTILEICSIDWNKVTVKTWSRKDISNLGDEAKKKYNEREVYIYRERIHRMDGIDGIDGIDKIEHWIDRALDRIKERYENNYHF